MSNQFRFNLLKNIIDYKVAILTIEKVGEHYYFTCYDRIYNNTKVLSINYRWIDNKEDMESVKRVINCLVYNLRRKVGE